MMCYITYICCRHVLQVRRMKHHPSIIILAGNNENEAALRDNWYGTKTNFDTYKDDYVKVGIFKKISVMGTGYYNTKVFVENSSLSLV